MSKPVQLSVPTPCHEKWENFQPTSTGGFCDSCSQNVIDFTRMTEAQIIDFIKAKPADACGRFRKDQLKDYSIHRTYNLNIKPSTMFLKAGMMSLLLAFINKPTVAQVSEPKPGTELTLEQKLNLTGVGKHIISGVVLDTDSVPIPGVNVVVAGTTIGTVTDADGKFQLSEPLDVKETLTFSFIGFITNMSSVGFIRDGFISVTLHPDSVSFTDSTSCFVMVGKVKIADAGKRSLVTRIKEWFR